MEDLRLRGPIAGIVHALPLGQASSGDPDGPCWSERIGDAVKGLFLLAKGTAADLEPRHGRVDRASSRPRRDGGPIAGPAVRTPSSFRARRDLRTGQDPGTGVADLVRCRVVDLAVDEGIESLAGRLADEVFVAMAGRKWATTEALAFRLRTFASPFWHARTHQSS